MRELLFLTVLATFLSSYALSEDTQKHWALLVAGSEGWRNYRHQADVCHAYHVVRRHGIPDERIVVMMWDDIANNWRNPYRGNVINKPNGPNLYPGVLKDYIRVDVNPEAFLKVLSGDETGIEKLTGKKGKVIKSGANDTIFVYFADHGAPGLIAFPKTELYADELNKVLEKMHQNKQYKQLVFYLEACESGSMFQNILKKDINVLAVTAANPNESSYACYMDKQRKVYLGDVFSVNWLEDSDAENLSKETLQNQFNIVKRRTNTSHVMQYGDLSMGNKAVGEFQGNLTDTTKFLRSGGPTDARMDAVKAEDAELEILKWKLASATTAKEKLIHEKAIREEMNRQKQTMLLFRRVVHHVGIKIRYESIHGKDVHFSDFKCYKNAIKTLKTSCPGLILHDNYHALRNLRVLANLCELGVSMEMLMTAIKYASLENSICI